MAEGPWHCKKHNLDFPTPQKLGAHKRLHHRKRKKKPEPKPRKEPANNRKRSKPPVAQVVLNFCPFCGHRLPNAHVGG